MEFKDYYKILGVTAKAPADEIKKAYRKLARKYHPDVSQEADSEEKFKEVSEAYEVLKDPQKRAEYDQLKKMGAMGGDGSFKPPPNWESAAHFSEGGFTNADMGGFSDFFDTIFGRSGSVHRRYDQSGQQQVRMRGDDIHIALPVFIEEAYHGCERVIEYNVPSIDNSGFLVHQKKKIKVKIPPQSHTDTPIRLKGQGGKGFGGGADGDLFIDLEFAPHPLYSVKGKDLYRKLSIAPWEAVLGAKIKVHTLSGSLQVSVPAGSRSGKQLRLKGRGLKGGDLYLELDIVVPTDVDDKQKSLYQQLAADSDFDPRAEEAS